MSNLRRSRGYVWEDNVVNIFQEKGFSATRLGGTTISMPDVSAHRDQSQLIIGIECKSSRADIAFVPGKQIQRCVNWVNMWGLYQYKMVILAFKFGNKGTGKQRERKEYLKIWNSKLQISKKLSCNYNGVCRIHDGGEVIEIDLEEFEI